MILVLSVGTFFFFRARMSVPWSEIHDYVYRVSLALRRPLSAGISQCALSHTGPAVAVGDFRWTASLTGHVVLAGHTQGV